MATENDVMSVGRGFTSSVKESVQIEETMMIDLQREREEREVVEERGRKEEGTRTI